MELYGECRNQGSDKIRLKEHEKSRCRHDKRHRFALAANAGQNGSRLRQCAQFPVGSGNDKSRAARSRLRNETFARTSSSMAERSSKSSMVSGSLLEG